MVARTTCLHCGTRSYAIVDLETQILCTGLLSTGWELPLPQAAGPGKAMVRFLSADSELWGECNVPGYRECSGKPLLHPPTPFLTIRSGSGTFSAMTWDLLRLHSFLLDLLIRFSLSSLRGTSSTWAPDEALRSTSGSRTDLSVENTEISLNTRYLTIPIYSKKTRGNDSLI